MTHATLTGEVHVWYGRVGATGVLEDLTLLSREEKLRCARIADPLRRRRVIGLHADARRILSRYVPIAPEHLHLVWDTDGNRSARLLGCSERARCPAGAVVPCLAEPLIVATALCAHRWAIASATHGPLALAMAAPPPPGPLPRVPRPADSEIPDRLRDRVRLEAAVRASGHPLPVGPAAAVYDLPSHGTALTALACAHDTPVAAVRCHEVP
ncbi:hypothetical protein [Streptomyces sp. NPDC013455]|uniref:hypothetical protein n=1 Tax=Streptomyces sp. NPDC013455 TaxID=3155605 RepID=UPI0033EF3F41